MKEQIFDKKSPIYGRRTAQLEVRPLDFFESLPFLRGMGLQEAAETYGMVGEFPCTSCSSTGPRPREERGVGLPGPELDPLRGADDPSRAGGSEGLVIQCHACGDCRRCVAEQPDSDCRWSLLHGDHVPPKGAAAPRVGEEGGFHTGRWQARGMRPRLTSCAGTAWRPRLWGSASGAPRTSRSRSSRSWCGEPRWLARGPTYATTHSRRQVSPTPAGPQRGQGRDVPR